MCVCVADCPEVTDVGLQYLNSSSRLQYLSMEDLPPYWLTDDKLQVLYGCSRLRQLDLGNVRSPIQANITAPAVTGSVRLHIHTGSCVPTP